MLRVRMRDLVGVFVVAGEQPVGLVRGTVEGGER
jgi:hypothetical protein